MSMQVSAHGRLNVRPADGPYGTHALVDANGELLYLLRSPAIRLDAYLGRGATIGGRLVEGTPSGGWPPLLDVVSVAVQGIEPMQPVPLVMPVIVPAWASHTMRTPPPPPPGLPAWLQTGRPLAVAPPHAATPRPPAATPHYAAAQPPAPAGAYAGRPSPLAPRRYVAPALAPGRAQRGIRLPAAVPDARPTPPQYGGMKAVR